MVKNWQADAYYESVAKIPLEKYYAMGLRLLLFDIDNTLAVHGSDASQEYAKEQLQRAREIGFDVYVLSNAKKARAAAFGQSLDKNLHIIGDARKPGTKGVFEAVRLADKKKEETFLIGDQIFTDIWAGRRAGILTVLVDPIDLHEPWYIRLKRLGEKILKGLFGKRKYYDTLLGL